MTYVISHLKYTTVSLCSVNFIVISNVKCVLKIKKSQRKPGNPEWTIQRNKKHWVSKGTTQQTEGTVNYKQSRDIGNIGRTRHRRTTIKAKEQHSKQKGQSGIGNPEKQETLGTQETGRRQTTQKTQHRKLNTRAKRTLPNPGVNTGVREGYAQFLPLIRHQPCYSYSQYVLDATMRK